MAGTRSRQIRQQMPVEKFGAVVAVQAHQGEWMAAFHDFRGLGGGALAFVPFGLRLVPSGANVCQDCGPPEAAGQGAAAVGHAVDLRPAKSADSPWAGAQGDLGFEGAVPAAPAPPASGACPLGAGRG